MPLAVVPTWPARDLGRAIRVVVFGGAFFEPAAFTFLVRLDQHPDIALVGGFCQSEGFDLRSRAANVVRRRGVLAPVVLGVHAGRVAARFVRQPLVELRLRRQVGRALSRVVTVPDIHAPDVLQRVRALEPDLGLVYGAPILKPQLFTVPTFGTLGIHHGKLPDYRGKKTTFWAVAHGEPTAGVAIQRINAGLDRGEIVSSGEVPIAGRTYGRVSAEIQHLGLDLYVEAVLAVKRGRATSRPQAPGGGRLYKDPSARDVLHLYWRHFAPGWRER